MKDTLFAWSRDAVLRIQDCGYSPKFAHVHLMQPELENNEGQALPARSISATIDAQKARDIATQFLMLAEEMEAQS